MYTFFLRLESLKSANIRKQYEHKNITYILYRESLLKSASTERNYKYIYNS